MVKYVILIQFAKLDFAQFLSFAPFVLFALFVYSLFFCHLLFFINLPFLSFAFFVVRPLTCLFFVSRYFCLLPVLSVAYSFAFLVSRSFCRLPSHLIFCQFLSTFLFLSFAFFVSLVLSVAYSFAFFVICLFVSRYFCQSLFWSFAL